VFDPATGQVLWVGKKKTLKGLVRGVTSMQNGIKRLFWAQRSQEKRGKTESQSLTEVNEGIAETSEEKKKERKNPESWRTTKPRGRKKRGKVNLMLP